MCQPARKQTPKNSRQATPDRKEQDRQKTSTIDGGLTDDGTHRVFPPPVGDDVPMNGRDLAGKIHAKKLEAARVTEDDPRPVVRAAKVCPADSKVSRILRGRSWGVPRVV